MNLFIQILKSPLGRLNFFILQMLFIRLCWNYDKINNKKYNFHLIYWIIPFTGWWTDYIFIGKERE